MNSSSSSSSSASSEENRPWVYRNGTFVFFTNLSLGVFGMWWTIQALFIEEFMELLGWSAGIKQLSADLIRNFF